MQQMNKAAQQLLDSHFTVLTFYRVLLTNIGHRPSWTAKVLDAEAGISRIICGN